MHIEPGMQNRKTVGGERVKKSASPEGAVDLCAQKYKKSPQTPEKVQRKLKRLSRRRRRKSNKVKMEIMEPFTVCL